MDRAQIERDIERLKRLQASVRVRIIAALRNRGAYEFSMDNKNQHAAEQRMRRLLHEYERWEADLVMCDEAWLLDPPRLTQELLDRLINLQAERNAILHGDTCRCRPL